MTQYIQYYIICFIVINFTPFIGYGQKASFEDKDIDNYVPKFDYRIPAPEEISPTSQGSGARVRLLLDSIFEANKKIKYMEGYRILAYSGSDKDEANRAKERFYQLLPYGDVYLVYKQPTYRIKLGDFTGRLEAKEVMMRKIIREYPQAIVIKDNILIKRPQQ